MESEQKPGSGGWLLWAIVLLGTVFVIYPASQGPAVGASAATGCPSLDAINLVYLPVNCGLAVLPARVRDPYLQYVTWWLPIEMRPEPLTSGPGPIPIR
jgi:hypothetical protein